MKLPVLFVLGVVRLHFVRSYQNTDNIIEVLEDLNINIAGNMSRLEIYFTNKLQEAAQRIKAEVEKNIDKYVIEAMKETNGSEMNQDHVKSEMTKLKHRHQELKGDIKKLMNTMSGCHGNCSLLSKFWTCSDEIVDVELLKEDLHHCETKSKKVEAENDLLNSALRGSFSSSVAHTTAVSTTATTATTRISPQGNSNRIIIAPYNSHQQNHFRQWSLKCDTLFNFQNTTLKRITAIAFIPSRRKMLVGLTKSRRILLSSLSGYEFTVVMRGVATHGLDVDEDADHVYMTTQAPSRSVSRMSVDGQDFKQLVNMQMFSKLFSIALDKSSRKIYTCDSLNIIVMTYEGRNVRVLAQGRFIFALSLDGVGNLYYGLKKSLMKLSLTQNTTSTVAKVGVVVNSMALHEDKLFFSSRSWTRVKAGHIGMLDVKHSHIGHFNASKVLKKMKMNLIQGLILFKIS